MISNIPFLNRRACQLVWHQTKKGGYFLPLAVMAFLFSCVPPLEKKYAGIQVDYSDPVQRHIIELQDRRQSDSLRIFLAHQNPTYRYLAVLGYCSLSDSTAIPSISPLLSDPVEEIRITAAHALGQIRSKAAVDALVRGFLSQDSLMEHQALNAAILEAIGKCGGPEQLEQIVSASTYSPRDTTLLWGQCQSVYRFMLRDLVTQQGTNLMLTYASKMIYPPKVRFMAAQYLSRAQNIFLDSLKSDDLMEVIQKEADPEIRIPLVSALAKTRSNSALQFLSRRFESEPDFRVRIAILRGLKFFPYPQVSAFAFQQLSSSDPRIARVAGNYFVENGIPKEAPQYALWAKDPSLKQARGELYQAAMKHTPPYFSNTLYKLSEEIRQLVQALREPDEIAPLVRALGGFGWNYNYLASLAGSTQNKPVVRTAAAQALAQITQDPAFWGVFKESANGVRRQLHRQFQDLIAKGDVGVVASLAEAYLDPKMVLRSLADSTAFLQQALERLTLPRDIEIAQTLRQALASLQNQPAPSPETPVYNHPIKWEFLMRLRPETRAEVQTTQGSFTLQFLPQWAPASVANFLELAETRFYQEKTFHRLVPNFVIQGGCPRGDGFGALDYTIRSEFAMSRYDAAGWVGMASAGKDTEGTQWFVTLAAAPHLDGRYTIFARVVAGMDVVSKLEPGDQVQKISLLNFPLK